jgi:hypothetical protein
MGRALKNKNKNKTLGKGFCGHSGTTWSCETECNQYWQWSLLILISNSVFVSYSKREEEIYRTWTWMQYFFLVE